MVSYLKLVKLSFSKINSYRSNLIIQYLTIIVGLVVQIYLWRAVFAHDQQIASYTFQQMIVYILFAKIVSLWVSDDTDSILAREFRTGDIIFPLIRPKNVQMYYLFLSFGECFTKFLFISMPLLVFTIVSFPMQFSFIKIFGVLLSLIFSFCIVFGINFLVGIWTFYFKSIDAIIWGKVFLINIFSGFVIPISFFPGILQNILNILPFKGIGYIPLQILTDRLRGWDLVPELGFQFVWTCLVLMIGQVLILYSQKSKTIQGG